MFECGWNFSSTIGLLILLLCFGSNPSCQRWFVAMNYFPWRGSRRHLRKKSVPSMSSTSSACETQCTMMHQTLKPERSAWKHSFPHDFARGCNCFWLSCHALITRITTNQLNGVCKMSFQIIFFQRSFIRMVALLNPNFIMSALITPWFLSLVWSCLLLPGNSRAATLW